MCLLVTLCFKYKVFFKIILFSLPLVSENILNISHHNCLKRSKAGTCNDPFLFFFNTCNLAQYDDIRKLSNTKQMIIESVLI